MLDEMLKNAWDVFLLFTIPIGGGIPAGVLLARSRGLSWPVMMLLYFFSDLALACVFEPLMRAIVLFGKKSIFIQRFKDVVKKTVQQSTRHYGTHLGPLALIMVAFGVDPMTGRAATAAAGHGFFTGWALAIAGDMMYFTLIMISTLWLSDVLGDGTAATLIILILMMVVPAVIRKIREKKHQTE